MLSLMKVCPRLGLPTQGFSDRVSASFLYLMVCDSEFWCVSNFQMNFLLQIPQREGGVNSLKYPSLLVSYCLDDINKQQVLQISLSQ